LATVARSTDMRAALAAGTHRFKRAVGEFSQSVKGSPKGLPSMYTCLPT
jgi:hypothetical protein